ncbi:Cyanophycinase [Anatilimnocola aggregata]|uniref:Cyanophycinase n=1 Tax=Anatilimnocola aggregata TaxID=2528021 RepID=A0A517Y6W7_9BACT|nr:cyanophycinase [Anatilimnocola aggregata]QDU25973.1 Cyanophycinase [Anatilimnocola aggregata]
MQCRLFAMLAGLVALLAIGSSQMLSGGENEAGPVIDLSAPNILGLPRGAISGGGSLMVCGGGQLPEEVYDEFVKLAGGPSGRLVLIPSAYPYANLEALNYRFNGWLRYPVQSFHFVHASTREEADSEEFARPLAEATGVWLSGGAQGRLADLYKGTRVEQQLQRVLERGGVIGGTSAGAAIMSETMIRYGTSREAVTDAGFGLLMSAVVDQHFTERSRHTRLLGVLGQNPQKIGLGVDEQTALIIRANRVRVLGQNRATVIVPDQYRTMSLHLLASGEEAEIIRSKDEVESRLKLLPANLAKK